MPLQAPFWGYSLLKQVSATIKTVADTLHLYKTRTRQDFLCCTKLSQPSPVGSGDKGISELFPSQSGRGALWLWHWEDQMRPSFSKSSASLAGVTEFCIQLGHESLTQWAALSACSLMRLNRSLTTNQTPPSTAHFLQHACHIPSCLSVA